MQRQPVDVEGRHRVRGKHHDAMSAPSQQMLQQPGCGKIEFVASGQAGDRRFGRIVPLAGAERVLGEIVEERREPRRDNRPSLRRERAAVAIRLRHLQGWDCDLVEKRLDRLLPSELLGLLGGLLGILRQEPLVQGLLW